MILGLLRWLTLVSLKVSTKCYFRQDKNESVKLFIEWMAIESVDDAIFTKKTDVVREIVKYCKLVLCICNL